MLQNRVGEASGTLLQHRNMLNIFLKKDFLKIIPVEIATGLICSFIMNNNHLNNNELMTRCVGGTRTFSTPLNSQMNFRKRETGRCLAAVKNNQQNFIKNKMK